MPSSQRVKIAAAIALVALGLARAVHADETPPTAARGATIYKERCAACHGATGEGGTKEHAKALVGDRSVLELAQLITKTMPEDDPGTCTGDEAQQVAAYIYDAFYSPTAQARIRPPRIELSRLTVRQYHNSVADLVGSFRSASNWGDQRGLKAQYFKAQRFGDRDKVLERIDPSVNFDFGEAGPQPDKFDPNEFSIRWEGSLLAPDSGDYEFIVHSEHAVRLWVNDPRTSLIDAWVKSGSDTEYRGTIRLLAGRTVPLKLEFSKASQGVQDKKFKSNKPTKASIRLEWQRPHRPAEIIPERYLSTASSPEVFVPATPFPPDDRTHGYERGTSISKAWDQATTDAAIELAGYVTSRLQEFAGSKEPSPDRDKRLREFCGRFAERAFRRPLSDEQKKVYVDRQFDSAGDAVLAAKRTMLLVLKSPRFLYRELSVGRSDQNPSEQNPGDQYDAAARLSFGLWDSPPDAELLRAAAAGELKSREQVTRQAERMLADQRTRAKLRQFFAQWLRIEQVRELAKDSQQYPQFTPEIANDLRTSLELFVDDTVWSERSDFRELLLSGSLPLNGRLASFFGVDLPSDAPFQSLPLDADRRAGVLTHPYLLAVFAYNGSTSPIHRGVFISRSILGRVLQPPPEAVTPLPPELHADLTTRERVALQTQAQSCMSCHGMINPLGFTLEHFDAVGRFRAEEKGRPIESAGGYLTRTGQEVKFTAVRDLAGYLADSEEAHTAVVEQLFHYLVKQPVRAYGPRQVPELLASFRKNELNLRKLVVEIVVSSALPRDEK